ncbi:hypothetical protein SeMB42_g06421 [Synchytrium endobioticum]|uniref:Uncharacterized protein n=1 Tax=Synchytrium endobioticum TaxID=286115 RepID=A0A507CHW3_9FUNG|nr:hypothetical protein SeMB42_g06421 [Synchytrium endobioticum]TPX39585.1 hypothetical protein SeLEV6574_g07116 [Synchytrium endobioticum]
MQHLYLINGISSVGLLIFSFAPAESKSTFRRVLAHPVTSNAFVITEEPTCKSNEHVSGIKVASYPQNSLNATWQTPICSASPVSLVSVALTKDGSTMFISYRSTSQILVRSLLTNNGSANPVILSGDSSTMLPGIITTYNESTLFLSRTDMWNVLSSAEEALSMLNSTDQSSYFVANASTIYIMGSGAASGNSASMYRVWITTYRHMMDPLPSLVRIDVDSSLKIMGQVSHARPYVGPLVPPMVLCADNLFMTFTDSNATGLSLLIYNTTAGNISSPVKRVIVHDRVISLTCMPLIDAVLMIVVRNISTNLAYAYSYDPVYGLSLPLALLAPTPVGSPTGILWTLAALDVAVPGGNGPVVAAAVGTSPNMSVGIGPIFATSFQASYFAPLLPRNASPLNPSPTICQLNCESTLPHIVSVYSGLSNGAKAGIAVGVAIAALAIGMMAYVSRQRSVRVESKGRSKGIDDGCVDYNRTAEKCVISDDGSEELSMKRVFEDKHPYLPPLIVMVPDGSGSAGLAPSLRHNQVRRQSSQIQQLYNLKRASYTTIRPTLERGGAAQAMSTSSTSTEVEREILNAYAELTDTSDLPSQKRSTREAPCIAPIETNLPSSRNSSTLSAWQREIWSTPTGAAADILDDEKCVSEDEQCVQGEENQTQAQTETKAKPTDLPAYLSTYLKANVVTPPEPLFPSDKEIIVLDSCRDTRTASNVPTTQKYDPNSGCLSGHGGSFSFLGGTNICAEGHSVNTHMSRLASLIQGFDDLRRRRRSTNTPKQLSSTSIHAFAPAPLCPVEESSAVSLQNPTTPNLTLAPTHKQLGSRNTSENVLDHGVQISYTSYPDQTDAQNRSNLPKPVSHPALPQNGVLADQNENMSLLPPLPRMTIHGAPIEAWLSDQDEFDWPYFPKNI